MKTVLRLVLFCVSFLGAVNAFAEPSFEKKLPKGLPELGITLPENWGSRIPQEEKCRGTPERRARSPELSVSSIPQDASHLVIYVYNRTGRDNHGMFRVRLSGSSAASDGVAKIASVRNYQDKFNDRYEIFEGGSQWGVAYAAPCPTSGSWEYRVAVYALSSSGEVVAKGDISLGWGTPL